MSFIPLIRDNFILFVLIISLLVFVHEYGHYWVGVKCGIKAEVFSIGFGREIWGWTSPKTGTRWRLSILPLGGYVKFLGDANASGAGAPDDKLSAEERKRAFHTQPLAARAAVVAAGPAANLIFAVIVLAIMNLVHGQPYTPPQVVVIEADGAAARFGMRTGDTILSIGGRSVDSFEDIITVAQLNPGVPLTYTVARDGKTISGTVTPVARDYVDRFKNTHRLGDLGVASVNALPVVGRVAPDSAAERAGIRPGDRVIEIAGQAIEHFGHIPLIIRTRPDMPTPIRLERDGRMIDIVATPGRIESTDADGKPKVEGRLGFTNGAVSIVRRLGPVDSTTSAVAQVWYMSGTIYTVIKQIVLGLRPASEIGGPIRIAKTTGEVAQLGWPAIIMFVVGLSVTLGVFNLVPMPMLDGGHLLLYAIEWLRGEPLSARAQDMGFRIGFAAVVSLMAFATWNDITDLAQRWFLAP
ncbi:MAG: RIP metalloprotease RseP [Rhodospirillales bacterium]|nr:RIP metalloprotease RseP [Rhodospirillales bacterium]